MPYKYHNENTHMYSQKHSQYPWQHNNVFSDDPHPDRFYTYTTEEFDEIIIDKVNKVGPTVQGNIAILKIDGDIKDSGVNIMDLFFTYTFLDGGLVS